MDIAYSKSSDNIENTFGISGTKMKYVPHLLENGIRRDNTAIFAINDHKKYPKRYFYTVVLAIYHAISTEVQRSIKNAEYVNFTDYYSDNIHSLPSLVFLRNKIIDQILDSDLSNSYSLLCDNSIATYPYGKVGTFGEINGNDIYKIVEIELSDVEYSECSLDISSIKEQVVSNRFFIKNVTNNGQLGENRAVLAQLLPNEIMLPLCKKLAKITLAKNATR